MIIDFTYPTIVGKNWQIHVTRTTKSGNLVSTDVKFENKKDAFDYYQHISKLWQYEKSTEWIRNNVEKKNENQR